MKILLILVAVLLQVLVVALILAITILFFRWLWNTTMPQVFGVKPVTFWQAVRLLLLVWFLFGAINRGPSVQSLESALTELRSREGAMEPKAEPAKTDRDHVSGPPAAKPEAASKAEPAAADPVGDPLFGE